MAFYHEHLTMRRIMYVYIYIDNRNMYLSQTFGSMNVYIRHLVFFDVNIK